LAFIKDYDLTFSITWVKLML